MFFRFTIYGGPFRNGSLAGRHFLGYQKAKGTGYGALDSLWKIAFRVKGQSLFSAVYTAFFLFFSAFEKAGKPPFFVFFRNPLTGAAKKIIVKTLW